MYLWIFVTGIIFAFYNAWGIGANDCANSFATSVGSKVLTLKQAVIIAAIFEFSGAVLMGSHVTDAIRKKIVDRNIFEDNPGALMYGMLCADLSSAIWLTVATYLKWPVSTTHSIIGAIVGFSLAYGGKEAVMWEKVGFIVLSWVLSPLLAGVFSSSFFYSIHRFIFRSSKPYENTMKLFPIITFFTFFINALFIIYKGSPQLELDELPLWVAIVSALVLGTVTALLAQFLYLPYAKKKINRMFDEIDETENTENTVDNVNTSDVENKPDTEGINENIKVIEELKNNESNTDDDLVRTTSYQEAIEVKDFVQLEDLIKEENTKSLVYDESKDIDENIKAGQEYVKDLQDLKLETKISELHSKADKIDPKAEKLCSWIQIITACFSSFAHGSNDVANAIAPLATIYHIYRYNEVAKKTEVPIWILALGGIRYSCRISNLGL